MIQIIITKNIFFNFSLGLDLKKIESENAYPKICSEFINNNLVLVVEDLLFYNGFEFHKIKSYYKANMIKKYHAQK